MPEERQGAPEERPLAKEKERGEKFVGEKLTEDIESRLEVPLDVREWKDVLKQVALLQEDVPIKNTRPLCIPP